MSSVHDLLTQRAEGEDVQKDCVAQLCDWTSSLLISIQEVQEGPQDPLPVNDVYFWRSQQEHMSRLSSWVQSTIVTDVVEKCQEREVDVVKKWNQVVKQLQQAERETSWNYKYIAVVLAALQTLSSDDPALPHFGPFMNSLSYAYNASMYFKDHRMIPLLRKVAKRIEAKTLATLPSFSSFAELSAAAFADKKKHALNFEDAFKRLRNGPGLRQKENAVDGNRRPQSAHNSWHLAAARTTSSMCTHGMSVCSRYAEVLGAMEKMRHCGIAWKAKVSLTHGDIFKVPKKTDVFAAFTTAIETAERALRQHNDEAPEIEEVNEPDDWITEKVGEAEVLRDVSIAEPFQIPDPFHVPARVAAEVDPSEVARQSAWYLAPPDLLDGVPTLSLQSDICLKPYFSGGRPQTAQPVLQRTREVECPDADDNYQEEVRVSWTVS